MESRSISEYIFFGTALRFLQDAEIGRLVHGSGYILENIDKFFYYLQRFNLPVTDRAAYKLRRFRDKLLKTESAYRLNLKEMQELRQIISDIRKTLEAEAEGNIAFIVTDKRIDVNKLLSNIPSLMTPGIFDSLPQIAKYDFTEAGKCIAFELPTAAAFHLLRGTESVLRHFYCDFIKRNRVKPLLWGPMVNHLKTLRKSPPTELLNTLDHIRLYYRNPTDHPEKIYDIHEAQELFHSCVEAITRMIKLVESKRKSTSK